VLAAADAALITLGMSIPGAVPSKIYEAMATSCRSCWWRRRTARRVQEAGCGLTVAPGCAADLRAAYMQLALDGARRGQLGAAGRIAAETIYNRDRIAERLDHFLTQLLPK